MKITKVFSGCCITPCTKINHINIIHLIFKEEAVVHKSLQIASLVQFFRLKHLAGSIWLRVRKVIIFICFLIPFFFYVSSFFSVEMYKLCVLPLFFWTSKLCAVHKQGRTVGGYHSLLSLQRDEFEPEYAALLSSASDDLTYSMFLSPITNTKDLKRCLLKHANRVKKVRAEQCA